MISLLMYIAASGMTVFCSALPEVTQDKSVTKNILYRKFLVKLLSPDLKDLQEAKYCELETNIHFGILTNGYIIASSAVIAGLAGTKDKLLACVDDKYYMVKILSHDPAIGIGILGFDESCKIDDCVEYKAADLSAIKAVDCVYINDKGAETIVRCNIANKPSITQIRHAIYANCVTINTDHDIPVGAFIFNKQQECIGICIKIEDTIHSQDNLMEKYRRNNTRVLQLFDNEYLQHMRHLLHAPLDVGIGKCPGFDFAVCDLGVSDKSGACYKHGAKVLWSSNEHIKNDDIIVEVNGLPVTTCMSFWYNLQLLAPWQGQSGEALNNISVKMIRNNVELLLDVPVVYAEISRAINAHNAVFHLVDTRNSIDDYPYGLQIIYINPASILNNFNRNDIIVAINDIPIHGRQAGINALNGLCADLAAKRKCKISLLSRHKELRIIHLNS